MKIGEAAHRSGVEASAIRFYESVGVVPEPVRTEAGYRDYSGDDVDLLRFVRRLRSLELPLDDVEEIVSLRTRGEAPCRAVRDAIEREAAAIQARMKDLRQISEDLVRLQEAAADLVDEWPRSCVCHVLEQTIPVPG